MVRSPNGNFALALLGQQMVHFRREVDQRRPLQAVESADQLPQFASAEGSIPDDDIVKVAKELSVASFLVADPDGEFPGKLGDVVFATIAPELLHTAIDKHLDLTPVPN